MLTFQLAETNLRSQKSLRSQNLSSVLTEEDQKALTPYLDQLVSSGKVSKEGADTFKKRMDNEKITWGDVKNFLGDNLWQQLQTWWRQQDFGKELAEQALEKMAGKQLTAAMAKPMKDEFEIREKAKKGKFKQKDVDIVKNMAKDNEAAEVKPPKIPKAQKESNADVAVVNDQGMKIKE